MNRLISFLGVGILLLTLAQPAIAEEGAAAADGPHPEFEYIELDPLTLPVITTKGLTQQISLSVSLEVPFGQKAEYNGFKPRLADAYIQDLYGALGAGFGMMKGNVVDVQQIKQRLTSVTDKVLGPDHKAHDVLLQVVQQRPM
jgi:hypothetical protein